MFFSEGSQILLHRNLRFLLQSNSQTRPKHIILKWYIAEELDELGLTQFYNAQTYKGRASNSFFISRASKKNLIPTLKFLKPAKF
jgi:hypothetical protein